MYTYRYTKPIANAAGHASYVATNCIDGAAVYDGDTLCLFEIPLYAEDLLKLSGGASMRGLQNVVSPRP